MTSFEDALREQGRREAFEAVTQELTHVHAMSGWFDRLGLKVALHVVANTETAFELGLMDRVGE